MSAATTEQAAPEAAPAEAAAEHAAPEARPAQPMPPAGPTTEVVRVHDDVATILARAVHLGLGAAILAGANVGRTVARDPGLAGPGDPLPAEHAFNVVVGLVDVVVESLAQAVVAAYQAAEPVRVPAVRAGRSVLGDAVRPVAVRLRPRLDALARRGAARRREAETQTAAALEASLPATMAAVLSRVDLTEHVTTAVDLRAVLDQAFEQIDMTGVALEHMDLDRIVRGTMARVDITGIALESIDMQRVVAATLEQVDMVALVRDQLDQVDVTDVLRAAPGAVAGGALRQTQAGAGKAVTAMLGRIAPKQ